MRLTILRVAVLGLILSYAVGWGLHYLYLADIASDHAAHHAMDPLAHYLGDSTLAAPFVVGLLLITTLVVRRLLVRLGIAADSGAAKLIFAGVVALTAATGVSFGADRTGVALATLRYTFALTLGLTLLFGVPWPHREPIKTGELVS